ncbi:prostatic acid phosphatase-like [Glandiceps talaboti]
MATSAMQVVLFVTAIISVTTTITDSNAVRKLEMVNLIYRHGARSPFYIYPTDPIKEESWPRGLGQLTTTGTRQQFSLGDFLRFRYIYRENTTLLNNTKYQPTDIYIRSSDIDRTLMSAQANLAGLFPPQGDEMWFKQLPWQPIPVHTVPKDEDMLLRQYTYDCPEWQKLLDEYKDSEEYQNMVKMYADFVKYVSKQTGQTNLTFEDIEYVEDPITCERVDNRTADMPEWTKVDGVYENMTAITKFLFYSAYKTPQMAKLKGGNILRQFVENISNKTQGTPLMPATPTKMFMYSAHDSVVAGLLVSLNVSNGEIPPLAGCVMVELYKEINGNYTVEIHYRNDTNPEDIQLDPVKLTIPGCEFACPLPKFLQIVEGAYTDNLSRDCGNEINTTGFGLALIIGISAALAVIIIAALLGIYCKCRKKNPYSRSLNNPYA